MARKSRVGASLAGGSIFVLRRRRDHMENTSSKKDEHKSSVLVSLLKIIFFPVTISFWIWKQNLLLPIKLGLLFVLWVFVLAAVAATHDSKSGNDAATPTPAITANSSSTTIPSITKEASGSAGSDDCSTAGTQEKIKACNEMKFAQTEGIALQHPLKANVKFDSHAVYITNLENTEWDVCGAIPNETISIEDFVSDGFIIKPGQTVMVPWSNMANDKDQRFNYFTTKPSSVSLECTVGGHTDPNGAFSGGELHKSIFNL